MNRATSSTVALGCCASKFFSLYLNIYNNASIAVRNSYADKKKLVKCKQFRTRWRLGFVDLSSKTKNVSQDTLAKKLYNLVRLLGDANDFLKNKNCFKEDS